MTDPEIDGVKPIYVQMVDCDSYWTDDRGICERCKLACGYTTVTNGTMTRRAPKPHQRPMPVYAVEECAECSCGGWHGTPVSLERQANGSEELLLSFQGRVDDIEKNQANVVDQLLLMNDKLDQLLGE